MVAAKLKLAGEQGGEVLDEGLMTVNEVAEFLRVSRFTVYRMIDGNELPSVQVRGLRRIPAKAVKDYVRASLNQTSTAASAGAVVGN